MDAMSLIDLIFSIIWSYFSGCSFDIKLLIVAFKINETYLLL